MVLRRDGAAEGTSRTVGPGQLEKSLGSIHESSKIARVVSRPWIQRFRQETTLL